MRVLFPKSLLEFPLYVFLEEFGVDRNSRLIIIPKERPGRIVFKTLGRTPPHIESHELVVLPFIKGDIPRGLLSVGWVNKKVRKSFRRSS